MDNSQVNDNREAFESWANTHGGLDLTVHEAMDNEKLPFPCTYYNYTTEIAWRAFANKKEPAQAALASQPQQPNAWQQAIDDELVNAHLGIAKDEITREEAKAELNKLIAWHIDVAKYFESQAQQKPYGWEIEGVLQTSAVKHEYHFTRDSLEAEKLKELGYKLVPVYLQSQAQQEPSKDIHEAITLLSAVFDAWENGTDCYDDFDGVSGSFIGKAFNLDDEIFKRCCDLLNRVNPPRNVSQAQQTESKPVAWGYAWQCKSVGDWRIEKLGEGCIPPKDTLALYALPPASQAQQESQWRPIATAPKNKKIIVRYKNVLGKDRTVFAKYIEKFTEESTLDTECETDYCEEDDTFYLKEGWVELIDNWGEFSSVYFDSQNVPTHWMDIPPAPEGGDK